MKVLKGLRQREKNSTKTYVVFQSIIALAAALVHGIAEVLKGNTPTSGSQDISVTIGAFSLIPNYFLTGVATIVVCVTLTIWTIGFVNKKNGATVFLILTILLFLVGGGVAPVIFLLITWGVATRINTPLSWWKKVLSENTRGFLSKSWLTIFIAGDLFLFTGIGIWFFLTPPGEVHQVSIVQYVCWTCLLIGLIFQILTIVSVFAHDIESQKS